MTDEEWRAFVLHGTRTAKVATAPAGGQPHVAPVWFVLDEDGALVFTTGESTVKGRALQRDPWVAMCVDEEIPPFAFVTVTGRAEVSRDLDEMLVWATRIGARYMGADRADAFGRRNAVASELLVRVKPERVVARAGISE